MPQLISSIINTTSSVWSSVGECAQKLTVATSDARTVLAQGIIHFIGKNALWLPEYEEVAQWLSDNKGRGLLCAGHCGRGKTVICQRVIPAIFQHWHRLYVNCITATDLNQRFEEIRSCKIISIDDIGTEPVANRYGERHNYVQEIIDEAERRQKLLILSTNCNMKELAERYDDRTIDRLRAITTPVIFNGESLRHSS